MDKILSPQVSDCFLFIHLFVVDVLVLDDLVDVQYCSSVEFLSAYLLKLLGKVLARETEGTLIAGNEDDVLVVLCLLLNYTAHVLVHVGSDQNVHSPVFGGLSVFLSS